MLAAWFAGPPEEKKKSGGFVRQSHVSTESLADTPGAELPHVIACILPLPER